MNNVTGNGSRVKAVRHWLGSQWCVAAQAFLPTVWALVDGAALLVSKGGPKFLAIAGLCVPTANWGPWGL